MTPTRAFTFAYIVRGIAMASLLPAAPLAMADETGAAVEHAHHQHPAVLLQGDVTALRQAHTIDTNQFMVAHPARLAFGPPPRANFAHPLFAMRRAAEASEADVNPVALQQPTAAQWLAHAPAATGDLRVASAAQPTP